MSLAGVAQETLSIVGQGAYVAPSGKRVRLRAEIDAAVEGTILFRPAQLEALLDELPAGPRDAGDLADSRRAAPRIEVTGETTAEAGRRLVEAEGERAVLALNFASAKNPGGGFLGGAKAQEEDLARCSALYTCQLTQRGYYDANRAHSSMLYTHHIIYSPDVPFFRDERRILLEAPFLLSIITAPAPNAGEARRTESNAAARVHEALDERARMVLAVAASRGHRCLVLGAWGCGVFRNDPAEVAGAFAVALGERRFAGAFDRVVFAVYTSAKNQATRRAFEQRFAPPGR
jgi:uncharacterized protein (TIGR02452 family)